MSTLVYSPLTEREYRNYKRKIRRQREIRNKIILAVISFILVLLFVFSFKTITSQAVETTNNVSYKYYERLRIEEGDSLWGIACEYIDYEQYDSIQDYIKEVKFINHLKSDKICSGEYIIVPYFSNVYQ